jgi:hypothetical protein
MENIHELIEILQSSYGNASIKIGPQTEEALTFPRKTWREKKTCLPSTTMSPLTTHFTCIL